MLFFDMFLHPAQSHRWHILESTKTFTCNCVVLRWWWWWLGEGGVIFFVFFFIFGFIPASVLSMTYITIDKNIYTQSWCVPVVVVCGERLSQIVLLCFVHWFYFYTPLGLIDDTTYNRQIHLHTIVPCAAVLVCGGEVEPYCVAAFIYFCLFTHLSPIDLYRHV